jgi:hypothetical protein
MPTTSPSRKGSDLKAFFSAAGLADDVLNGDRCPRRRVFLVRVVALEDLSGVIVPQGCGGRARNLEKQIHSDREIRRKNKSSAVALNQFLDPIDLLHTSPSCRRPCSCPL